MRGGRAVRGFGPPAPAAGADAAGVVASLVDVGGVVVCPDEALGNELVVWLGRDVTGRRERLATAWKSPVGAMARCARERRAKAYGRQAFRAERLWQPILLRAR